jgi:hypothetical protein
MIAENLTEEMKQMELKTSGDVNALTTANSN